MKVFLVRHGETEGNIAKRHQHPDTPLNANGNSQASAVANRLFSRGVTHIISSRQKRALETAEQIAKKNNRIPTAIDLFEEMYRPGYLIGERRTGWRTWKYMFFWYTGVKIASMHDRESYADFLVRIHRARQYLESFPDDAVIVVVSHAAFISFFIAHLNHSSFLGFIKSAILFIHMVRMKNTEITELMFTKGQWIIVK
jgi:broad specificity phosphatase PhoE